MKAEKVQVVAKERVLVMAAAKAVAPRAEAAPLVERPEELAEIGLLVVAEPVRATRPLTRMASGSATGTTLEGAPRRIALSRTTLPRKL